MANTVEHLDVLIVGAGLSGIGAACYLQTECPWASYAIFEARDAIGGTWDLFRYPGIRSDSDMFTLGYSFRPWDGEKSIADGDSILQYIKDTATENGVDRTSASTTGSSGRLVDRRSPLARHRRADRHRRDGRAHLRLRLLVHRLLPLRPRLPARLRRHGPLRRHHRPPPAWPEDLDWRGKRWW
jgi:cation diffusion facilitator CzcD-associated flavoprotein CzcO